MMATRVGTHSRMIRNFFCDILNELEKNLSFRSYLAVNLISDVRRNNRKGYDVAFNKNDFKQC